MIQCTFTDVDKQEVYLSTEPVSLAEAKAHLRVDFSDDDSLLSAMITSCRQAIEDYCHISLVTKTITLTLKAQEQLRSMFAQPYQVREQFNEFELPYGPIQVDPIVTSINSDGFTVTALTLNTDFFLTGVRFKSIKISNNFDNNMLVYTAGYTAIPGPLKLAILNELAYRYEARGDAQNIRATAFTEQGVCVSARILADPYKRLAWI